MGEAVPNLPDHAAEASGQVLSADFGLNTHTLVAPEKLVATDQSMVIPFPQREDQSASINEDPGSSEAVVLEVDPGVIVLDSFTGSEGTSGYNAKQSVRAKYPYLSFEVNSSQILGNGIVAPTAQSRLRACLHALQAAWEDAPALTASELGALQSKVYDLEKVKVAIPGELGSEKKVARSTLLQIDDIMNSLYTSFITENHPITQLDAYLQETFPDLPRIRLQELRAALTIAIAHEVIESSYLDAVRSRLKALRQSEQPS